MRDEIKSTISFTISFTISWSTISITISQSTISSTIPSHNISHFDVFWFDNFSDSWEEMRQMRWDVTIKWDGRLWDRLLLFWSWHEMRSWDERYNINQPSLSLSLSLTWNSKSHHLTDYQVQIWSHAMKQRREKWDGRLWDCGMNYETVVVSCETYKKIPSTIYHLISVTIYHLISLTLLSTKTVLKCRGVISGWREEEEWEIWDDESISKRWWWW